MADISDELKIELWRRISVLIPHHSPYHPKIGHRPRVSNWIIFRCLLDVLDGDTYRQAAIPGVVSASTLERRRNELFKVVADLEVALIEEAYKAGLVDIQDIAIDGCIAVARSGGEEGYSGRSPVNRGKQGYKRSVCADTRSGICLGFVLAQANDHDSPLLVPTLNTLKRLPFDFTGTKVHLDAGYDSNVTRERLEERGFTWNISRKGERTRGLHGKRYRVEVLNSHHNGFSRLAVTNEVQAEVQEFWVRLANCILILRKLMKEQVRVAS